MGRKLKIYQAGYAYGENSWEVVAQGEDIETARSELFFKIECSKPGQYDVKGLRYVETYYYEDEDVKKER